MKSQADAFMASAERFINNKIYQSANEIKNIIVDKTPVDTEALKKATKKNRIEYKKNDKGRISSFKIKLGQGKLKYTHSIMILGRRKVDGKWYGSDQLPDGILPTIKQWVEANHLVSNSKLIKGED